MSTSAARIAAFVVLLSVAFTGALALGSVADPAGSEPEDEHEPEAAHDGEAVPAGAAPPGLQVAADGYRLIVDRPLLTGGDPKARLGFRIVDEGGEPVRDFELEHERRMHFIVVRRDLGEFQHLHPAMAGDGAWSTPVDLSSDGSYRVFADFKHDGAKRTLGADVQVGGPYRPARLARPGSTATTEDGLEVSLHSDPESGGETRVEFEVRDGGRVVNDRLQPYLGAKGHLVALRVGDLAYLHTHPDGDELAFDSEYPSAGSYGLFVQFRYRGSIQTAAFTQEVGQ